MSHHKPQRPEDEDGPELDVREYSRQAVTLYEVGVTEAWIEAPEDIVVDAQDMR